MKLNINSQWEQIKNHPWRHLKDEDRSLLSLPNWQWNNAGYWELQLASGERCFIVIKDIEITFFNKNFELSHNLVVTFHRHSTHNPPLDTISVSMMIDYFISIYKI